MSTIIRTLLRYLHCGSSWNQRDLSPDVELYDGKLPRILVQEVDSCDAGVSVHSFTSQKFNGCSRFVDGQAFPQSAPSLHSTVIAPPVA